MSGVEICFLKKFQEISDEVLKNAPNKRAVEAWKIQMNKYKNKVANNATLYEAEQMMEGDKNPQKIRIFVAPNGHRVTKWSLLSAVCDFANPRSEFSRLSNP